MTEYYLIAHKVRGEPAFDVAIKMDVETDDEPWWIIPTSGHRAYPYWNELLTLDSLPPEMPPDWPDHYEVSAAPKAEKKSTSGLELLYKLGLKKPMERRL